MVQRLFEQWPHSEAVMTLKPMQLHWLRTLAFLEHQGRVSSELEKVWVYAPFAGNQGVIWRCIRLR